MDERIDKLTAEQKGQLGFQAFLQGDDEYAAVMLTMSIEELRERAGEDIYYTLCLTGLGQVRLNQERLEEAEALFQEALSHYQVSFKDDLFGRFSTLCYLGSVRSQKCLYDQARLFYERALDIGEAILAGEPVVLSHACLEGYADVLRRLNLDAEAQAVEDRIKAINAVNDLDQTENG